jgi:hypothetical protein
VDRRLTTSLLVAASASAGAGMVHAAAAGSHNGDPGVAWLFAVCAVAQLGWAVLVVTRPSRPVLAAGALLNAACALAWVLSRTVGLVGPLSGVEVVGTQDLIAAAFAAVATGAALVALRPVKTNRRLDAPVVAAVSFLVLLLAVPAMAASHTHGDGSGHQHGDTEVAAAGTGSVPDGHVHTGGASAIDAAAPIISLDDARLTAAQRARAAKLLDTTRVAMRALYPDKDHVVAAGYTWIGDGRTVGGFEHFVNTAYMADGRELDPLHIEAIVLQRQADGSEKVMTAMYILERGKTLADAPDLAGSLTPWHDHQNLCWDASGVKLAGIVINGKCRPGGTFRPTAPMMHVWLTDPPCGPFSGVEGHGASNCTHDHAAA